MAPVRALVLLLLTLLAGCRTRLAYETGPAAAPGSAVPLTGAGETFWRQPWADAAGLTPAQRDFLSAREAYWNHDTAAALTALDRLLARADPAFPPALIAEYRARSWEADGAWAEVAAAYRAAGIAPERREAVALADALAARPGLRLTFAAPDVSWWTRAFPTRC
jgi:hypothetical protein